MVNAFNKTSTHNIFWLVVVLNAIPSQKVWAFYFLIAVDCSKTSVQ
tara:strand:+ start:2366 stop:2503 length:138 start_codon:yes stop_codon:yes gene_type:complete